MFDVCDKKQNEKIRVVDFLQVIEVLLPIYLNGTTIALTSKDVT